MTSLLYPGPLQLDKSTNDFRSAKDVAEFDFNILDFDQDFDFNLQPDLSNGFLTGFELLDHALAFDNTTSQMPEIMV